jgi:hypothetical protein
VQEIREAAVQSIVSGLLNGALWAPAAAAAGTPAASDIDMLQLEGLEEHVAVLRAHVGEDSSLLLVRWHQLTPAEQGALELGCIQRRFPGAAQVTWNSAGPPF